jgi:hypothetical protein
MRPVNSEPEGDHQNLGYALPPSQDAIFATSGAPQFWTMQQPQYMGAHPSTSQPGLVYSQQQQQQQQHPYAPVRMALPHPIQVQHHPQMLAHGNIAVQHTWLVQPPPLHHQHMYHRTMVHSNVPPPYQQHHARLISPVQLHGGYYQQYVQGDHAAHWATTQSAAIEVPYGVRERVIGGNDGSSDSSSGLRAGMARGAPRGRGDSSARAARGAARDNDRGRSRSGGRGRQAPGVCWGLGFR